MKVEKVPPKPEPVHPDIQITLTWREAQIVSAAIGSNNQDAVRKWTSTISFYMSKEIPDEAEVREFTGQLFNALRNALH